MFLSRKNRCNGAKGLIAVSLAVIYQYICKTVQLHWTIMNATFWKLEIQQITIQAGVDKTL